MSDLQNRIRALSDLRATQVAQALAARVAPALSQGGGAVDPSTAAFVGSWRAAAEADAHRPLEGDVGGLARGLLKAFAEDDDFSPLIEEALQTPDDDQLLSKPILALGAAATLIIIAATSDVKIDAGPVQIHKVIASPDLIRGIGEVVRPISIGTAPGAPPVSDGRAGERP